MLAPSEEVTRTWIKKKSILIDNKPIPSRFSFSVCLAIAFSIIFGFLAGFITASFAMSETYSGVYESLLTELEISRLRMEQEKKKFKKAHKRWDAADGAIETRAAINKKP